MEATKRVADDENEVDDVLLFKDAGVSRVTPVLQLDASVALGVVNAMARVVQSAHELQSTLRPDSSGITRSQKFEEGDVYMLSPTYENYAASRYIMDFYDVDEMDICSRMHFHTGMRLVRIMTGPGTIIRISGLSPFDVTDVAGVTPFRPRAFEDPMPDLPDGQDRTRFNLVVPENSWVDMQIPKGVAHQFNAIGPNAVIDTVHPEDGAETEREHMSDFKMMAQTVFLADERPPAETCDVVPPT